MADQPTPAHYCPACRTTTPAPQATAEALVQAGVDHRAECTGTADLRQRLAAAIRTAAYDCDGTCGLTETECDAQHPIQVAAQHWGETSSVYADIDPLAAVAAAVVQPELDQLRAELDRTRAELADAKAAGMRAAAAMLRRHCPDHGPDDVETAFMDCHCAGADEINRDATALTAAVSAPTA